MGLERAGFETVAFCEYDEHAQRVLAKHWPNVPIHEDVRTLDGKQYAGTIDVICGGFPCQDLSVAGKKAGFDGERSSLYREMLRLISESRPRYAIFENVTGLLTGESGRWFAQFLYDLAEVGYDAVWHCISASFVGAPHHRDRVWIIAYATELHSNEQSIKQRQIQNNEKHEARRKHRGCNRERQGLRITNLLANAVSLGQQRQRKLIDAMCSAPKREGQADWIVDDSFFGVWATEPSVGRVVNGVWKKSYEHRLKQLGNAVVPVIPEMIGRAIMEFEKQ